MNSDLSVTVRVPRCATRKDIERILKEKQTWVCKHIELVKEKKAQFEALSVERLTNEEIKELVDKALTIIPERVAYYAKLVGVDYGHITIRN